MRKIKVAFFCDVLTEDIDGALRTMYHIFRRIPKDQFEFLFICGAGPKQINGFECYHMASITLPRNEAYNLVLPILSRKRTVKRLDAFAPDIIHVANPSYMGHFALRYAEEHNNIPVSSIFHSHFVSYVAYYFRGFPQFFITYMTNMAIRVQRRFYNRCTLSYIPSESILQELIDYDVEAKRLKIWKRGINTTLFTPDKRDVQYVRNITGNDQKNILFVSRLDPVKNLDMLGKIYEYIQEQKLPYNFIVAGDGVARSQTEKSMPNAFFLGNQDHDTLSILYASCDVFIFPSITESYGNVIIEAMCSGLPCVVADANGPKDVITSGENGFKCTPDNLEEFIDKIKLLLSDHEVWKRISANGVSYSQNLDWNQLVSVYFEDLRKLHSDHQTQQ
jgi:glycosyltransferase involved in cell wall biosynthesis